MANLSNINNRLIVTDGGNLLVNATANLATYGGITIDNFSDPSIAMKTTGTSGWLWTQYITSTGTNNFSMGVNQSSPYWCVKAGAGMDSPHLVVDSSGDVGIGTITPVHLLQVKSSYDDFITKIENDLGSEGGNGLWVDTRWNVANNVPFKVTSNSGNSPMMIIKGSGAVGIGITDPSAKLEVKENLYVSHPNAEEITFRLDNYGTTGTDAGSVLRMFNQAGTTVVNIDSRGGSSRDTHFNQGGNFGIGTSSPDYKLQVEGTASKIFNVTNTSTYSRMLLTGASGTGGDLIFSEASTGTAQFGIYSSGAQATSTLGIYPNDGSSPAILVKQNGNVGIGTSSPYDVGLQVSHSLGNGGIMLGNTATTGSKEMLLNIHPLGLIWQRWVNGAYQANLMTLDYDGNLGIGTTSPGTKLEISDATGPTIRLRRADVSVVAGDLIGGIENYNQDADGAHISSFIRGYATETYGRQGYLTFGTSGVNSTDATEKMRITSGGNIDINSHTGATIGYGVRIAKQSGYSQLYMEADTTSTRIIQRFYNPTGNVGNISIVAYNTTYSTSSSDERLKKNITNWDENILDKFKDIKPKEFHFHNQDNTEEKQKGYIAQNEVDKFPEAYPLLYNEEAKEDRHMFNPSGMVVYLMKAIQELKADNDSLKARIETLENN